MKRSHEAVAATACAPPDDRRFSPSINAEPSMAKSKDSWATFKPDPKAPDFAGDKLQKAWKELHAGDGEPWPDDKRAAALIKAAGKQAPKGLDAKALATALQEAWRAFHRGEFRAAFEAGEKLGVVGASVAVKA